MKAENLNENVRELTLDELDEVSGGSEFSTIIGAAVVGGAYVAVDNAIGESLAGTIKRVIGG